MGRDGVLGAHRTLKAVFSAFDDIYPPKNNKKKAHTHSPPRTTKTTTHNPLTLPPRKTKNKRHTPPPTNIKNSILCVCVCVCVCVWLTFKVTLKTTFVAFKIISAWGGRCVHLKCMFQFYTVHAFNLFNCFLGCFLQYPHLPQFEGDDLRRLGTEISLARKYLKQAKVYKEMYKAKTTFPERPSSAKGPRRM